MVGRPSACIVALITRGETMTTDAATSTIGTTAATLDLLAADFTVDSPAVREAAARHWYASTPLGPAVLRYEDCAAILRDRRFRQASADHLADQGVTDGPLADMWRDIILNIEGDRHGRLRRLVSQAFTPAAVDRLRPRMRDIVHGLVDALAPAGECEFMAAFADQYPPQVMFDLLGIPEEDHEQFLAWGKTLALTISYSVADHAAAIDAARSDLYAATDWLCAARRLRPGDDLISRLVAAADDGDRLTTQELRSMVVALVVGGQDSTRNQLGLAMILFARQPDQWALLARRPDLAARATEEVMRLSPASPFVWRMAGEDLVWRDLAIPAGTRLWLVVGAAHTDEAAFGPDARRFDITAERPAQLAFGHGVHYCLGAALARAEMTEALPILAARLPDLELAGPPVLRPELSGFAGPDSLPIRFWPSRS
jgi:cytochrome P450